MHCTTTLISQFNRKISFWGRFNTDNRQNPAKIRQNPTNRRHMTSRRWIFIKTSENVYSDNILTVSKNEVSSTTTTENMTSFVFLALVWESIGKLRQ